MTQPPRHLRKQPPQLLQRPPLLSLFLAIIRGIFLKGNGLEVLWPQVLALAAFGVGIMSLSALRFSKRLG